MKTRAIVALAAGLALVLGACAPAPSPSPSASPSPSLAGSSAPSGASVVVFFGRSDLDPCEQVVPVIRTASEATPEAALRALLAGPTPAEQAAGYVSVFTAATADTLIGVEVGGGTARVSFLDLRPIIPNASASCGSGLLLSSLDATLRQFPGISRARYSFGGDEAAFYEWLQRSVPAQ